jgi:hypothetical protein
MGQEEKVNNIKNEVKLHQKMKADGSLEAKLHAFLPSSLDATTEEITKSGSCCGRG